MREDEGKIKGIKEMNKEEVKEKLRINKSMNTIKRYIFN